MNLPFRKPFLSVGYAFSGEFVNSFDGFFYERELLCLKQVR